MGCALLRLEKKKNFIESIVSNCRKLVEVELGGGGGGVGEGIWWVGMGAAARAHGGRNPELCARLLVSRQEYFGLDGKINFQ
jgi:hypothetical protein